MDEKDLLQIKIDTAKASLAEETKDAINAVDWRATVLAMREKKGYSFSQLEDLEIETELMLYGLVNPKDFPKELEARMHLPKEEVSALIEELNNTIFQKIRGELIKISERKEKQTEKPIENKDEAKTSFAGSPDASGEAFREQKNTEVLNQAGIEITEAKQSSALSPDTSSEVFREKRDEMISGVENPENIIPKMPAQPVSSILEKKLNASFQVPSVESVHTEKTVAPTTSRPAFGGVKTDPYREPIE